MTVKEHKRHKARITHQSKVSKTVVKAVDPQKILGRAMLVNVNIKYWDGRKHDAQVTADTNARHHANSDAGRYHKRLLGGRDELHGKVNSAMSRLRLIHYTQTLPWTNDGWRLLPSANYFEYTEQMRKAIREYDNAADDFEAVYPKLVKAAAEKLGDMYNADDYPSAAAIRNKFRAALEFSPLPAGDDFRLTLPKEELARMAAEVEGRLKESVAEAMKDAWERLGEAVTKIRAKLDDGKYLRDSMFEDLGEVCNVLGRLNLTEDKQLEATRKQVMETLASFDAETLKKDEKVRSEAAKQADQILKSMAGLYAPLKDDEEE